MTEPTVSSAAGSGRSLLWRLVPTLCAAYMLSQFLRSANAVIAPNLIADLHLSSAELGLLTGLYFAAFAVFQIPVGMMLDRFGSRLTMSGLMLVAAGGALVFADAGGFAGAALGDAMMGAGTAPLMMGSLVLFSRWVDSGRFATLSAVLLAVGTAGSLLATEPLGLAAVYLGWRGAFVIMAAITAAAAILVALLVRDAPAGHAFYTEPPEPLSVAVRGILDVLRNPEIPYLFAVNLTVYGVAITIQGLWGGPYLHDVEGLGTVARGQVLLVMALGAIAGYLVFGPLDRWCNSRKIPALGGVGAAALFCLVPAVIPEPPVWLVTVDFALIGIACGAYIPILAHGRAIFPSHLVGRGMTTLNVATMGGAAALQFLSGWVIGLFPRTPQGGAPEIAYQAMFAMLALVLIVTGAIYARAAESRPRPTVRRQDPPGAGQRRSA